MRVKDCKKYKFYIFLLVTAFLSCLFVSGCGNRLSGEYSNNEYHVGISFSSKGDCSMYVGNHDKINTVKGIYYWDSAQSKYHFIFKGNYKNSSTGEELEKQYTITFTAVRDGKRIIIVEDSYFANGTVFEKGKLIDSSSGAKVTLPSLIETSLTEDNNQKTKSVGIAFPSKSSWRWNHDGDRMRNELESLGYKVQLEFADNNATKQKSQIEEMINNDCSILVIAPVDANSLATVIDKASSKNIRIISYDKLIMNANIDYYLTFDSYMVGKMQGEYIKEKLDLDNATGPFKIEFTAGDPGDNNAVLCYQGAYAVLKPYIDSGKLIVDSGQKEFTSVATPEWSTATAQSRAINIIRSFYADKNIDAWLCSNDSIAQGVINALDAYYNSAARGNKWPIVTGQDCDIISVKNMLAGKQTMSVFKDTRVLVSQTVKMIDQIYKGEKVEINDQETYNNGSKLVASYICDPEMCDANNYKQLLIDSGYYSKSDLS